MRLTHTARRGGAVTPALWWLGLLNPPRHTTTAKVSLLRKYPMRPLHMSLATYHRAQAYIRGALKIRIRIRIRLRYTLGLGFDLGLGSRLESALELGLASEWT